MKRKPEEIWWKKTENFNYGSNLIYDDDNLIRCEGRFENAPLPYEVKTPYLIITEHCLAILIVKHFHESLLHISIKQTLTALRQKWWICCGRNFVRKILTNCNLCRKYEDPPYQYPATPSLTKLRFNDTFVFFTTGIDNLGPLYVNSIFTWNTGSSTLHKVWVALYTCASSRGIVLDLVPSLDSVSFIRSFRRFVSWRECRCNAISDNGENCVLVETKRFVSNIGVNWITNLPLAPWHGGFFERLIKSTNTLSRKQLEKSRLNYEELQTVLCEVETILNNRPLTYYYSDNTKQCVTPNHLLFGRTITNRHYARYKFSL